MPFFYRRDALFRRGVHQDLRGPRPAQHLQDDRPERGSDDQQGRGVHSCHISVPYSITCSAIPLM